MTMRRIAAKLQTAARAEPGAAQAGAPSPNPAWPLPSWKRVPPDPPRV